MKKYIETDTTIKFKNEKDLESLKEFKRNNFGCQSKLYYLKKGKEILKVYNNKVNKTEDLINFLKLKEIDTETLVKFKKILLIDNKYSGYSMDKIIGTTYYNISNDNIRDILTTLKKVEKDIIKLSENKIIATDLNLGNIIYNRKKQESKLIDVNSYIYEPDIDTEYARQRNCYNLYNTTITALSKVYTNQTNIHYLNCILEAIYKNEFEKKDNIYDFFNHFITDLENYCNEEIVTIGEFSKILKNSNNFY